MALDYRVIGFDRRPNKIGPGSGELVDGRSQSRCRCAARHTARQTGDPPVGWDDPANSQTAGFTRPAE
jgi:hypothetical protein